MSFTAAEIACMESALAEFMEKRRPPLEVRPKLDLAWKIEGWSVVIFLLRPFWRDPAKINEEMVAKATWQPGTARWRILWQRADLKWHGYEPHPEAMLFEEFLQIVDEDEHCCFWG